MKSIAFFNNKGGVGKTSLVYHLAWMFRDLGLTVVAADLDPQANLSSMFVREDRLEQLWPDGDHHDTILGCVEPILRGLGDISEPHVEEVSDGIGLVVGDLGLSRFEANLSSAWPNCLDGSEAAFRTISSFYRVLLNATSRYDADVVLIDVGPNLGAINRSALIAANHVVVPLAADLFSLQGLKNLGPNLRDWRKEWHERLQKKPADPNLQLPSGQMSPAGYVVLQHAVRLDRPVKAYERWLARIPSTYHVEVLHEDSVERLTVESDAHCLAQLKNYRSLMPLAQDALKPMFYLKPADGALGAHVYAVANCRKEFADLGRAIARSVGLNLQAGTLI